MPYSLRLSSSRNSRLYWPHLTHWPAASAILRLRPNRFRHIASFISSILFNIIQYSTGWLVCQGLNPNFSDVFSDDGKSLYPSWLYAHGTRFPWTLVCLLLLSYPIHSRLRANLDAKKKLDTWHGGGCRPSAHCQEESPHQRKTKKTDAAIICWIFISYLFIFVLPLLFNYSIGELAAQAAGPR